MDQGDLLKQYGIDRVASHNPEFIATIVKQANIFGQQFGEVTSDDLRLWANLHDIYPDHSNAWGAVFRELGRDPRWTRSGFTKSQIPSNHARIISVWKYE